MRGERFRLTVPTRPARDALLAYLAGVQPAYEGPAVAALAELRRESKGRVAIAFEDGGLLQSLDAWSNAMLPVSYHAAEKQATAARRAKGILAVLGRRPEDFIGRTGASLTLYERRVLGFVRAMLVEPELLVLDRLMEELGREEREGIAACIDLFASRYPLRRMLYIGFAETDLSQFEVMQ